MRAGAKHSVSVPLLEGKVRGIDRTAARAPSKLELKQPLKFPARQQPAKRAHQKESHSDKPGHSLSLIHISEPTRPRLI
eukprot:6127831-Amphidinium_carterae.1